MLDVIASRRSIRRFLPTPVEREKIELVLEAGRRAPSAVNLQPARVLVVDRPEDLAVVRAAAYNFRTLATAPVVLVCMADLSADARAAERLKLMNRIGAMEQMEPGKRVSARGKPFNFRLGEEIATMGATVAIAYMDLQAVQLGLGTCWWHHAEFDEIRDHFKIPPHLKIVALLPLGYPNENPEPRPRVHPVAWDPSETQAG